MAFIDDVISSGNLLEFLERLDRVLEVYGGTRRNERVVAVALRNSLFPLCSLLTSITVGSCVTAL